MYTDPDDLKEQLAAVETMELEALPTYIQSMFKDWVVAQCPAYSSDYSILQDNWNKLCHSIFTDPKAILIVEYVPFPDYTENFMLLQAICERLTKNGYCIRRKTELQPCEKCGKALVTKFVHDYFMEKSDYCPREWRNKCSTC
jgi:hypothetical protein